MEIGRTLKHLFYPGWWLRRHFPPTELQKIEAAIKQSEAKHSGEIRFAIESSLPFKALWHDETISERGLEVFSMLRVWDTEDNNGVLIYLSLADHKIEIIADRAINRVVPNEEWQQICRRMEVELQAGNYGASVVTAINEISQHLEKYFPRKDNDKNELSDKAVVL